VPQQHERVGALELRVGVGEVLADVAEPRRAEECVGDRVGDGVGVAVSREAAASLEGDAAEHQWPRGVVVEAVDVESLADSHAVVGAEAAPGPFEVGGIGDLAVVGVAVDDDDAAPAGLDERGVIGCGAFPGGNRVVRGAQRGRPERLRCLHRAQLAAIGRRDDAAVGIDLLDGVAQGQTGHRAVCARFHGVDHAGEDRGVGEGACRVVHADDRRVDGHRFQPVADALAPCLAAGDAALATDIVGRHDHHHTVARGRRRRDRPVEHAATAESLVLLGAAEALARSTCDDDGPDTFGPLGCWMRHGGEGSTVRCHMAHEELLARTDFFADAPPSVVRELAAVGSELHLIRGDVIFRAGDVADALYLVISGRIAIAISNPIDHRETVVALMDSGDLFGEMAMLDEGTRSAMARALEPSTVLTIPFDPVVTAFRGDPTLLWAVTRLLAQRLRVMDEALADSVFLDVTGRTAKRLLELSDGQEEFMLPITQEELAGMVGASRERVNKAIASFIRLGWIDQHERRYTIIKRDSLELRAR